MKRLFENHKKEKKYRYAIIILLIAFSVSLTFSPTGLVAYPSALDGKKLIDIAFGSESVRDFVAKHDVNIGVEEVRDIENLKRSYPGIYSNLPSPVYQIILDAGENSLVVLLDETAIYRIFEN